MAGTIANARIWLGADVYVAPTGTAAPTDIATALNAAFIPVGLLSEDGMTESQEDEQADHYAYGGTLVRSTRSKHKRQFTVTVLEDNVTVFDLVNPGSSAAITTGITTRTINVPNTPNQKAFVFQLADGDVDTRIYIPTGEVTEVGDREIVDNELATRELTITVYPDSSNVLYLEITDDPQADPT